MADKKHNPQSQTTENSNDQNRDNQPPINPQFQPSDIILNPKSELDQESLSSNDYNQQPNSQESAEITFSKLGPTSGAGKRTEFFKSAFNTVSKGYVQWQDRKRRQVPEEAEELRARLIMNEREQGAAEPIASTSFQTAPPVPDTEMANAEDQGGIIYLSEVYQQYNGKIPPSMIMEFSRALVDDRRRLISERKFNHDWIDDYLLTIERIEKDKLTPDESYKKLDRALTDLPRSDRTTVRLNELVITPRAFDGEHPRAMKWIQEYNEAIVANGWSDSIAIKYLPTYLSKAAKDWYFVEIKPQLTDQVKWQHVYEFFVANFLSEKDYEQLSAALDNIKQRHDESVSVFFPRLRRLLLLLTPGMTDGEQFRQLKNRLRPEYKQLIAFANPRTITELRDCCLKVEAGMVKRNTNAPRPPRSNYQGRSQNNQESRRGASTTRANPKGNYRRRGNYRNNRASSKGRQDGNRNGPSRSKPEGAQKSEIKCYNCGKGGHYSKDCWSKAGNRKNDSKPQPTRGKQRVNFVQENGKREEAATQVLTIRHASRKDAQQRKPRFAITELKHEKVQLVVGGGKLLKQKVVCNDVEISAVVDTGAYVSVIDEEIVNHFKWQVEPPQAKLVGADGGKLQSKGSIQVNLEVTINNTTKQTKARLAIVKGLTAPMLLGLELMKELKICIDAGKLEIRFSKGDKGGIKLIRDEVLPPRSQAVVEARVNMIGLVLTVPFMHENGVAVANSVAEVNDNLLPLALLNPSNKPLRLKKGTKLASAELMDEGYSSDSEKSQADINQIVPLPKLDGEIIVGDNLGETQVDQLKSLLNDHIEAFSIHGEICMTNVQKHSIELLPGSEPFAEPLRRRAPVQIEETRRQVRELMKEGIIEESNSPWASAYVLAKKKNGEMRLCIDFRKLNAVTKKTCYPLPHTDDCLETLSGKKYFTQLDFKSGFWQIEMDENSKELTAFRTEDGQFQFKRMPFGLTNAPATFQKMINTVLAGLKGMNLQVFIDDICIATKTWSEHLAILKLTLETIIKARLKVKADKCVFGASSVKFLGHEISEQGIRQDPEKLRALQKLPAPNDCKGVKRVMGMFAYYRKFVENFSMLAEPLTKLTRKGVSFAWGEEQANAFNAILRELNKNATLAHFNHVDPVMLKTDASKKGVAGMLLQRQNGDWKLVCCTSRRLTTSETNYGITDLEGLAVIHSVNKFRPYLLGKKFQILVDHCALCVLNKRTPNSLRLKRWAIILSEFDFEIIYTKGKLHCDIDCLSRAPVDDPNDHYLDDRVYLVQVGDPHNWIHCYNDQESREFIQKGYDKKDGFELDNYGVIYKDELVYVPTERRAEIITYVHCADCNAHPGITATTSKLMETYWWPDMRKDVEYFVKGCMTCFTNKPDRTAPAGQMHSFQIFAPGEQLAVDLIEKMKPSTNGNEFIIVAIDMFSRFVEAKAVPDKSTPHFVQFLVEYAGRYGVPKTILSDNAGVFTSEFAKQLMTVLGAAHIETTPHHSQANAVCERVNQTIQEKLRLVLDDPLHERNWDSVLPIAVLAINTTRHTSLGCTPYEMTFGRRAPLQDKFLTIRASPTDMHIKLIRNYLRECHSTAVAIQCASQERAKRYYEANHRNVLYEIGDLVVVQNPTRSRSKLQPKFKGPYKIIDRTNDIYTLEEVKTKKRITRARSKLEAHAWFAPHTR